ncbi:TIGR02679 domain-containing protein [Lapillicoccus sp.]|uniref:TIGR02679 domain-containing protein n=1 Tax=Lapillicoccus sp. TaxID=1909287 RepID=UPI003983AC17
MTDPLGLPSWWSLDVLARVWELIANRLERNGIRPTGRLVVADLDRSERHALGDLLGRSVTSGRASIDLGVLDRRLSERAGVGLVEAVEQVRGQPLVDRPQRRAVRASRRQEPFRAAEQWLVDHPGAVWPWVAPWLEGLRRDGSLMRDPDPTSLLLTALDILWSRREALAEGDVNGGESGRGSSGSRATPVARTELAARTAYDAHALDADRRLSTIVLRALATRSGIELSSGAAERRALWESAGVVADSVSSTCLTWGLLGLGLRAPASAHAAASGPRWRPVHLTWWDLEAGASLQTGQDLIVCENPRVLEAIAQTGIEIGVVCTSGRPNLVVIEVLSRALAAGARMRYHGDFDWPGVAMANDAAGRFGAAPWLMGVDDYLATPGSLTLVGSAVEPSWDPELGPAMRRRGLAVHEEAMLERLIDALSE